MRIDDRGSTGNETFYLWASGLICTENRMASRHWLHLVRTATASKVVCSKMWVQVAASKRYQIPCVFGGKETRSGGQQHTNKKKKSLHNTISGFISAWNLKQAYSQWHEYMHSVYCILPHGPGVDSASNGNEYQEYFLGVKAASA